jgi:hypothetical protein
VCIFASLCNHCVCLCVDCTSVTDSPSTATVHCSSPGRCDLPSHHGLPGAEATSYCVTCRHLVCSVCVVAFHPMAGGHQVLSIVDAAAALRPALAADVDACSSSLINHSALLARLRSLIESALERNEAGREAIVAHYATLVAGLLADADVDRIIPGLIAGRDAQLAAYDCTFDALVSTAREQEQRVTGAANEIQLLVDVGTAALASTDPMDIIQSAASVAATKRVAIRREYPLTECGVEFAPIPLADVRLTVDGSPVVAGRIVAADVDMVCTPLSVSVSVLH